MTNIFNSIKDKLYYLITGYMTKMGMISWGGEYYSGPVPWDSSTWGTGHYDNNGNFVSLADTIAAAAQAPSWLAPQDYTSNGFDAQGVSTSIAPSNPYGGYSQAPASLSPNDYAATGFSPSGENLNASPNISASTGALASNAQGSNYVAPVSQLSTNPDPSQPFNFVASPYVNAQNPFSLPINNAIESYLGRPATQAEMYQYTMILAQNPDAYNSLVEGIRTSTEAANAAKSGIQNLIIDPKQGDMTGSWLNASYGKYTPTSESGLSKITNAIGGAIPLAALGVMTGGLGAAAGLGAIAGGALAGGVTGAAGAGLNGGNVGTGALMGAATGALGGAASGAFNGASNVASGGQNLGSNFNWNLPSASDMYNAQFVNAFANPTELGQPYAQLAAGPNVTVTGAPSSFNDYGATNTPLVNANSATSNAGNVASGGLDLGSNFTWNGLPLTETVAGTGLTIGQILSISGGSSILSSLLGNTAGGGINGTGASGTGGGNGSGGTGTGSGGNGPGGNGPNTPNTPNVNPNIKLPGVKIPAVSTTPTLSTALRSPTLYQSAPGGLYKANTNPFMFGKEQPVQNARQSYDPFAALNVPQTPLTETPNLLAQALRQG